MYPNSAFDPSLLDTGIESLDRLFILQSMIQLSGKSQVSMHHQSAELLCGGYIL